MIYLNEKRINGIAECVFESYDHLGEGVIWDVIEQCIFWLDVPMPSKLHRVHHKSELPSLQTTSLVP